MSEDYTQTNNCIEQIKKRHESNFNLDYISDVGFLLSHIHTLEKEIDRLREGIQATLSYTLPYLAERTLKELLEEGKDERDGLSARCPICGVISNLRPDYGINESGTAVLHRLSYCGHLLEWRLKDDVSKM